MLPEVSEHHPTLFCLTKCSKWSNVGPTYFAIALLVKVTKVEEDSATDV